MLGINFRRISSWKCDVVAMIRKIIWEQNKHRIVIERNKIWNSRSWYKWSTHSLLFLASDIKFTVLIIDGLFLLLLACVFDRLEGFACDLLVEIWSGIQSTFSEFNVSVVSIIPRVFWVRKELFCLNNLRIWLYYLMYFAYEFCDDQQATVLNSDHE